jgi:hypothetical protein
MRKNGTSLKETPVIPETYPWQAAYLFAILETDKVKLIECIADARRAIEERLFSPIEYNSPEHLAIRAAWNGLAALKAERLDGSV